MAVAAPDTRPFVAGNLKPAAYELTLGPNYMLEGKEATLSPDRPWLTLPPNSIVFVSMAEQLLLPHYIAARFDLAIEFIYQGILLGTGPQVDPGFQGVLSCPLHNISNAPVHLQLGYPFAKIDFAKTSGLRASRERVAEIGDENELYAARLDLEHGLKGQQDHLTQQIQALRRDLARVRAAQRATRR